MARDSRDIKKVLRIIGITVFFLLIVVYAFFRSYDLLFGIKIRNVSLNGAPIQSGAHVAEKIIKLSGNAKNAVSLTLNGREISIDQSGDWNETIALLPGYNVINIKAVDKFGSVDEKNYQLTY
jgi:hypothetical protein